MPYRKERRPIVHARFKGYFAVHIEVVEIEPYSILGVILKHLEITIVAKLP